MSGPIGIRARSSASFFVVGMAFAPAPGIARAVLDLSGYDCTRPTDLKTASGDQLAAEGYRIANKARFGDVNIMMTNSKITGLATCFLRPEARN